MLVQPSMGQKSPPEKIRLMLGEVQSKISRHRISINRCQTPPVIDGKLDDSAWEHAALLTHFIRNNNKGTTSIAGLTPAGAQSLVHVTYDDEYFYVGAQMMEPDMQYLVSVSENRDETVWKDDCLEWFLDTDFTGKQVIQIISNNAGIIWDGHDYEAQTKIDWTCEGLKVATSHGKDSWYVEWAVPYAGLGMPVPKKGDVWRMQFARQRYTTPTGQRRENSTWVGSIEKTFKMPDWFGEIVFNDVATTQVFLPETNFGTQEASIAFYNARNVELPLTFVTRSTGEEHRSSKTTGMVPAGQNRSFTIPFTTKDEGAQFNVLQVYSGTELLSVIRKSYFIEPISGPMKEKIDYALMLSNAESQSQAFRQNMAKRTLEMQSLYNQLINVKKLLVSGNLTAEEKKNRWDKIVEAFYLIDIPTPPAKPKVSIWR